MIHWNEAVIFALGGAAFIFGVCAVVLLMMAILGRIIIGPSPLHVRWVAGSAVLGCLFIAIGAALHFFFGPT